MAKKKYYCDQFKEAANNIKSTWNIINQLLNKKKQAVSFPPTFVDGSQTYSNYLEIANGFNNYFVNIGMHVLG